MEIKRASKKREKVNIGVSLDLGQAKSMQNSIAREQAIWQNTAVSTAQTLGKSIETALATKGESDALKDAADDQAKEDEYNIAEKEYDDQQMADLENEDDFYKQSPQETRYLAAEEDLKNKALDMTGGSITSYGKSYQAKAQQIGLNKLIIDLDKTSTELYVENSENPAEFNAALTEYSMAVKEQLPESLHASWDEKLAISSVTANKRIASNVKTIQDQELAATTVEKMDLTRTKLLNAADNQDAAAFVSNKTDYVNQIEYLYDNRLIKSRAVADEKIRTVVDQANSTGILSSFKKTLKDNPKNAIKFFEAFSDKTSSEMYGMSERELRAAKKVPKDNKTNPLDIEYDTYQRDKIAAQMYSQIKAQEANLKAKNKQSKTDNNKFAKQEIELLRSGKFPDEPLPKNAPMGEFERKQLQYTRDNYANIVNFRSMSTVQDQEKYIAQLKSRPTDAPGSVELIEMYEGIVENRIKENNDNAGQVTNDMMYKSETFAPQFDATNPREFLDAKMKYTNFLNLTENAPKNLMSNAQANNVEALYKSMGSIDKNSFILSIGGDETAELFFDQMGEIGSEMKVAHNILVGGATNATAVTQSINVGQDRLTNNETKYNEDKINVVIRNQINGRMYGMDPQTQEAYRKSIAAYALGSNPTKELIDNDDTDTKDMIGEAINQVFGRQDTVRTNWIGFGGNDMVVYNKSGKLVTALMDATTTKQVQATIPAGSNFFSKDQKNPLTAKTVSEEIAAGKIKLKATGVVGEYILIRANRELYTAAPSGRFNEDGTKEYLKFDGMYKFKLWSEGK